MYSSIFVYPRHKMGVDGQSHAPATLPPRKKPGAHCTRGWVG